MGLFRASIIADIHNGPDKGNKYGSKAPRLVEKFVEACNRSLPDVVIDLGDRISAINKHSDIKNMSQISKLFNKLASPFYSVIGNHDIRHLSRNKNREITGHPAHSYTRDIKGFRLVFWNPDLNTHKGGGIKLSPDDLSWLGAALSRSPKPVIIFSHVPLDTDAPANDNKNSNTNTPEGRFSFANAKKARDIIQQSNKVLLSVSGHKHINKHSEIDGTHYITLQSLVQAQKGEGKRSPYGTYATIAVDSETGSISIDLQGKYNKSYDLQADKLRDHNP